VGLHHALPVGYGAPTVVFINLDVLRTGNADVAQNKCGPVPCFMLRTVPHFMCTSAKLYEHSAKLYETRHIFKQDDGQAPSEDHPFISTLYPPQKKEPGHSKARTATFSNGNCQTLAEFTGAVLRVRPVVTGSAVVPDSIRKSGTSEKTGSAKGVIGLFC
jgi:hypothetical protein